MTDLPKEIYEAIEYEIVRGDDDCADNYRAYREHDGFRRDEFLEAVAHGCCGSFEGFTYDRQGAKWIIGYNYGH